MAGRLDGKRIAILATDGVEEAELAASRDAVTAEGARVDVVSLEDGPIQAMNHDLEPASTIDVDLTAAQASPSDYDALILPGGTVNADRLRMDGGVRSFVREIVRVSKPVGVICHGPWTLIDAGRGRGPDADLVPEPAHGPDQCRREMGRRGGRHRRGAGVQPQPRRPRRVLLDDRRGVRGR